MTISDRRFVVGVDIGGTFTDCVGVDSTGRVELGKAFSTPPDFTDGIIDALERVAEAHRVTVQMLLSGTHLFLHSTTVAENAIVNGDLVTAGVLTTRGHVDTLFAMRGGFGRWSGLTEDEKRNPIETDKPPPLIPRQLVRGIMERIDVRGDILQAVEEKEIETAVAELIEGGAEAIGVSFLWSFVNPKHEQVARDVIQRKYPALFLTLSSDIAPIIGEYERSSTVALNARLGPVVRKYLDDLEHRLEASGFKGRLLVMQAYGGLLPFDKARQRPVGMIESGPVSGLVGARHQAQAFGFDNIIATDMGGTTFKVGVVRDGLIEYQREPSVFRYHYALPKMDVISLGLAGGSVIWIEPRTGVPHIGPQSAGSYPGPVCYDHGGVEPTLADVDAILGYLNPNTFLGGRAPLNIDKAREIFEDKVARPLGMDAVEGAAAIYRLANSMIYDLLHRATVQRGLDPRRFALLSFGGAAGMHMASYGEELGVNPIIVPHSASVQGAFGLVISDVVHEDQITQPMRLPVEPSAVDKILTELKTRILDQLTEEGFSGEAVHLQAFVDMSYRQQTHILTVPLPAGQTSVADGELDRTVDRFESMYRDKYGPGSGYRAAGIEMVVYRMRGYGAFQKPVVQGRANAEKIRPLVAAEHRLVWIDKLGALTETPGYAFENLHPGNEIAGPAIIWTPITTIVLSPTQQARVDAFRNVVITPAASNGSVQEARQL